MTISASTPITHQLPVLFSGLSVARVRGESETGLELAARAEQLLREERGLGGLACALHAHVGALEVNRGRLDVAADRLARGLSSGLATSGHRAARADCAGQLALVEAFRGNLEQALREARSSRENAAGLTVAGVEHTELAVVWVHLERGEDDRAAHLLRRMTQEDPGTREPWLRTARLLAETRLLSSEGNHELALELLSGRAALTIVAEGGWLEALVTVATAEVLIAAGEPKRALSVLTPLPRHTTPEASVLAATARRDIGDLRGARADLAVALPGLASSPLAWRVRAWVLEAQLALVSDDVERARRLVDRALRAAAADGIRRPLAPDQVWLRTFVDRDRSLRGHHRDFVASVPATMGTTASVVAASTEAPVAPVEELTHREIEVLVLLAEMYATDEIARELFLSVNTVKTHIKGVFRKLDVNRRNAAVRRGRELGLC